MPLYHFPAQGALVHGLWEAITELQAELTQAIDAAGSARVRLHAWVDAFFRYDESRPDSYRLVFMQDTREAEGDGTPDWGVLPACREVLQVALALPSDLARGWAAMPTRPASARPARSPARSKGSVC